MTADRGTNFGASCIASGSASGVCTTGVESRSRRAPNVGARDSGAEVPLAKPLANPLTKRVRVQRVDRSVQRSAFSLLELLVVLAVTVVLTSILFPAFRGVRQSALRLACASNQRQVGTAIVLYASDHADRLPPSRFAAPGPLLRPQEMMAATVSMGGDPQSPLDPDWEGLGWLIASPTGAYLDTCACLYCPSHQGDHPYERYEADFRSQTPGLVERIYTNYHYRGDRVLGTSTLTRFMNSHDEILVSDGLRTQRDFNHVVGGNLLHGDGAVTWFDDTGGELLGSLPVGEISPISQMNDYPQIWAQLTKLGTSSPD